ncbi:MAG: hypothetical protein Q4C85_08695 [Actinomyces sp.]|uniref:hypothetical protein n=1 Tax=Actinomyces sp. TaxID=29317 RepID=UPI0026DD3607|nr:hypothetical protein [Actinomyces sp.]MDO4243816.1 hypothetical protein [Actinomyces sp.]
MPAWVTVVIAVATSSLATTLAQALIARGREARRERRAQETEGERLLRRIADMQIALAAVARLAIEHGAPPTVIESVLPRWWRAATDIDDDSDEQG